MERERPDRSRDPGRITAIVVGLLMQFGIFGTILVIGLGYGLGSGGENAEKTPPLMMIWAVLAGAQLTATMLLARRYREGRNTGIWLGAILQGVLILPIGGLAMMLTLFSDLEPLKLGGFVGLVIALIGIAVIVDRLKAAMKFEPVDFGQPHQWAQQAGAGQPATRPESDSGGSDKRQPESEGRSR